MNKPRLCEILGVNAMQRFKVYNAFEDGPIILHIDLCGNVYSEDGLMTTKVLVGLCHAIERPNDIELMPMWREKDKADARAIEELFQDALTVRRGDDYVYLRTSTNTIALTADTFPTLEKDEEVTLDEILWDENESCKEGKR